MSKSHTQHIAHRAQRTLHYTIKVRHRAYCTYCTYCLQDAGSDTEAILACRTNLHTPAPIPIPTTTSPSDSSTKVGGVSSVIIFTVSILGTAIAVALITATICHFKKKKRSEGVRAPKVDDNADYGFYYSAAGALTKIGLQKVSQIHMFHCLFQVLGLMKDPWR